jgi:hypothetical protein
MMDGLGFFHISSEHFPEQLDAGQLGGLIFADKLAVA